MQGVIGAFNEIDSTVHAIEDLKKQRFGDITVYTPTPRHELEHAMKHPPSKVRIVTLIFGLAGVTFGYWIPIWMSDYWPLVVGGKPIVNNWKSLKEIAPTTKESDALSKDLIKRGFKFVGSTVIYAHMQACGLVNDHLVECWRYIPTSKLK